MLLESKPVSLPTFANTASFASWIIPTSNWYVLFDLPSTPPLNISISVSVESDWELAIPIIGDWAVFPYSASTAASTFAVLIKLV